MLPGSCAGQLLDVGDVELLPQAPDRARADAGQARHLHEADGDLIRQLGEELGRPVFGEVAYHLSRRRADVGQRLEVLHLGRRATEGGHRLGGPLVAEHAVVGFVFDLHERRYRLERTVRCRCCSRCPLLLFWGPTRPPGRLYAPPRGRNGLESPHAEGRRETIRWISERLTVVAAVGLAAGLAFSAFVIWAFFELADGGPGGRQPRLRQGRAALDPPERPRLARRADAPRHRPRQLLRRRAAPRRCGLRVSTGGAGGSRPYSSSSRPGEASCSRPS